MSHNVSMGLLTLLRLQSICKHIRWVWACQAELQDAKSREPQSEIWEHCRFQTTLLCFCWKQLAKSSGHVALVLVSFKKGDLGDKRVFLFGPFSRLASLGHIHNPDMDDTSDTSVERYCTCQ